MKRCRDQPVLNARENETALKQIDAAGDNLKIKAVLFTHLD